MHVLACRQIIRRIKELANLLRVLPVKVGKGTLNATELLLIDDKKKRLSSNTLTTEIINNLRTLPLIWLLFIQLFQITYNCLIVIRVGWPESRRT